MNRALLYAVWCLLAAQLILAGLAFHQPSAENVRDPLVRHTAIVPVTLWFAAMLGVVPRLAYGLGCGTYLLHVAVAFHAAHDWSHAAAMSHVENASGWGVGIFASYAFTLIWLADALWWLRAPRGYERRSRILHMVVYGFMAIIIFNATVIYGHGFARLLGVIVFVTLVLLKWAPSTRTTKPVNAFL